MINDGKQREGSEDSPSEAITHAQEYMQLLTVALDSVALDQALLAARRYFQTLLQCNLLEIGDFLALNRQALALADAWRPSTSI